LTLVRIAILFYIAASLVTFIVYGWDKRCARRGKQRVRERTLHIMELLGGWPGALVAMRVFNHKRRKRSYMAMFIAIIALHVGLWIAWWRWLR
jgi:uncharacterized membrane protein YsdA (DUF1294 family)